MVKICAVQKQIRSETCVIREAGVLLSQFKGKRVFSERHYGPFLLLFDIYDSMIICYGHSSEYLISAG